MKAWS